jgi:hypothetical protein
MTISKKVRQQVIDRDGCCPCCGDVYMLTIQHRINRGMGGSRKRDNLANLMVLCSMTNAALESDPVWQLALSSMGGSCVRGMTRRLFRYMSRCGGIGGGWMMRVGVIWCRGLTTRFECVRAYPYFCGCGENRKEKPPP